MRWDAIDVRQSDAINRLSCEVLVKQLGTDRHRMFGIGGRNSEFGTAIRLNPGLTHALGNGVSTTFGALLEDCLMYPRASIGVVILI
jgi:hypothetical protein